MLYVDSKGGEHVISEMNPAKLINAINAMKRDGWNIEKFVSQEDHDTCLAEMEAQAQVNRTRYIAELKAELPDALPDRAAVIREALAKMEAQG